MSSINWKAMPRFQANSPSFSSTACRRAAGDRAQLGAGGEEAGRLAIHQFHAIGFGDADAADAVELNQFAFHHHLREADQQIEDMEIALAQGDLKGLHVEPVAGQHAGVIAPLDVGRRAAAAGLGHIDHIVVNQRGGVQHFDHRAQLNGRLCRRRPRSARTAAAARAQALAAALLQVPADGGNGLDRGDRFDVDRLFDALQILAHEIEDLGRGEDLACALSFHRKPQCNGSHFVAQTQIFEIGGGDGGDALGGGFRAPRPACETVSVMKDGSLRLPRQGMGARYGASVSIRSRSSGVIRGGFADMFRRF
jgi:hypothetical protein